VRGQAVEEARVVGDVDPTDEALQDGRLYSVCLDEGAALVVEHLQDGLLLLHCPFPCHLSRFLVDHHPRVVQLAGDVVESREVGRADFSVRVLRQERL